MISRSFSIFLVKANLSRFMAGTLGLNLVRYILLLKNLNSADEIVYIQCLQVSAVDVDQNDDPVVFHRGPVVWNGKSFDSKNRLVARKEKPIQVEPCSDCFGFKCHLSDRLTQS